LLKEVYLDALRNKETKISKIKDSSYADIIADAKSRWIPYQPNPAKCESAGVDSSWNKRAFQGLNLYVVDAVAVTSKNKILATAFVDEIAESARQEALESMAMSMEAKVAHEAAEKKETDIICIDGSIIPRLNKRKSDIAIDMVKQFGNSIFVAKSSESRAHFASMGSRAGDIYYYNHATGSGTGFSIPVQAPTEYVKMHEIYTRIREHTPIVRIEVAGDVNESEIKAMLDRLTYHSVGGYPYCLKLAHNNCKISNDDLERIASILSLQHEHGARDALNE
jgi:NurA-like 5'-3' nuclease